MSTVFRHYGHSVFHRRYESIVDNIDTRFMKPTRGLWASPVESSYGWKQFCEDEEFRLSDLSSHFDFTLTDTANIYVIDSFSDLKNLIDRFPGRSLDELECKIYHSSVSEDFLSHFPDYHEIAKIYDGVQVNISYDFSLYHWMYGWDVDSIVVWNHDVIVLI